MTEQQNFWDKLLGIIVALLSSLIKTASLNGTQQPQSQTPSGAAKTIVTEFLQNKALGLFQQYKTTFKNLNKEQKEFVYNMSILKAADISELDFDEVIQLGEVINRCSELNIVITKELSEFWDKVGSIAKDAAIKSTEIRIKMAAKALVGFLPI